MRTTVVTPEPVDRPLAWLSTHSARLLRAYQHADAFRELHRFLGALAPVSNFIVFEFAPDRQPALVDCNYEHNYMLSHMAQYCGGLYLLDPFWRAGGAGPVDRAGGGLRQPAGGVDPRRRRPAVAPFNCRSARQRLRAKRRAGSTRRQGAQEAVEQLRLRVNAHLGVDVAFVIGHRAFLDVQDAGNGLG